MPLVLGEIIGFGIHLTNFIGVPSGSLSGNDAPETVSHQADFATFSAIKFLHTLAKLRQIKMAMT